MTLFDVFDDRLDVCDGFVEFFDRRSQIFDALLRRIERISNAVIDAIERILGSLNEFGDFAQQFGELRLARLRHRRKVLRHLFEMIDDG